MASTNHIRNELQQISPLIATLYVGNSYQVPQGYFEGLPGEIMNRIKTLEYSESIMSILPAAGKINPFVVPDGYFEGLAGSILNIIRASEVTSPQEELEELSPLLGRIDKTLPFAMPEKYFANLPNDVIAGVTAIDFVNHELEVVSPVMDAAKNKNVFEVPEGYFDNVPGEVLNKVKLIQSAKVILLDRGRRIMRYAVAAVLVGAIAIGGWLFFQEKPAVNPEGGWSGIEKVSDEEIANYLDNNSDIIPESSSTASFDIKEDDVRELLGDVSDEELQQYLEQHSLSKDL